MPDSTKAPYENDNGTKYWVPQIILTYGSKNDDGVQNREYISGGKCFQNRDGGMSEVNFWYKGGDHQLAQLWETVAKAKELEPDKMSPRDFVVFLNSKPKVKVESRKYDNWNPTLGKKQGNIYKNMPGEFL